MPEVNFRVDMCLAQGIQKVGDQWERVSVLLGDAIDSPEVDAKPQGTVLFLDEQDRSSVRGVREGNEAHGYILVNKLMEGLKLLLGQRVDRTKWRGSAILQCDLQVVWPVVCKDTGFCLAKYIGKIVILLWDAI